MNKRAVIYTRVSTKEQTTESQLIPLKEYAKNACLDIVEIIQDEGVSGGRRGEDRAGFQKVMMLVRQRKVDSVLVYSVDRIGRNLGDIINIAEEITETGANLTIYKNGIDTNTVTGKQMIKMFALLAEFERDFIRARVADGIAVAKAKGKRIGRAPTILDEQSILSIRKERKRGDGILKIAKRHKIATRRVYEILEEKKAA